jgi:hypothetical protein
VFAQAEFDSKRLNLRLLSQVLRRTRLGAVVCSAVSVTGKPSEPDSENLPDRYVEMHSDEDQVLYI